MNVCDPESHEYREAVGFYLLDVKNTQSVISYETISFSSLFLIHTDET